MKDQCVAVNYLNSPYFIELIHVLRTISILTAKWKLEEEIEPKERQLRVKLRKVVNNAGKQTWEIVKPHVKARMTDEEHSHLKEIYSEALTKERESEQFRENR